MGDLEEGLDVKNPLQRAQAAMLSMFLQVRQPDIPAWKGIWSAKLGRPYDEMLQAFIKAGLLRPASTREKAQTLKVTELKSLLRDAALKVSGTKPALVTRLAEGAAEKLEAALATVPACYVCTERGASLVQRFKQELQSRGEADLWNDMRKGPWGSVNMKLLMEMDNDGKLTGAAFIGPTLTRPDGTWEVTEEEADE